MGWSALLPLIVWSVECSECRNPKSTVLAPNPRLYTSSHFLPVLTPYMYTHTNYLVRVLFEYKRNVRLGWNIRKTQENLKKKNPYETPLP